MSEEGPRAALHSLATTRVRRGLGVLAIACLCFGPWAHGWRTPDGGLAWAREVLVRASERGLDGLPGSTAEGYLVTMGARVAAVLALALPLGALLLVVAPRSSRYRLALVAAAAANAAALALLLRLGLAGERWSWWLEGPAGSALGWLLEAFPAALTGAGLVALSLDSPRALPILRGVSYATWPVALAVGARAFPMWGFPGLALLFAVALRLEARSAVAEHTQRARFARAFLALALVFIAVLCLRAAWFAPAPPTLDPTAAVERRARRHVEGVSAVAFVESDVLATGSQGGTIRLWALPGGRLVCDIRAEGERVEALAFDPATRVLYSAHVLGPWSGIVRAWTLDGREVRPGFSSGYPIAFSSDGQRVASALEDRSIRVCSTVDGTVVLRIPPVPSAAVSLAFSPAGDVLVTGSGHGEGRLRLWSLVDGELLRELESFHEIWDSSRIEVAPRGHPIATVKHDAVWLLDVVGEPKLLRHRTDTLTIAFSPDGELLAVASVDRRVTLWSVASGELLRDVRVDCGAILCVRFSPDGECLVLGCSGDDWLGGGHGSDGTVVFVPVRTR